MGPLLETVRVECLYLGCLVHLTNKRVHVEEIQASLTSMSACRHNLSLWRESIGLDAYLEDWV